LNVRRQRSQLPLAASNDQTTITGLPMMFSRGTKP
jgi:hypothetical protein